MKLCSEDRISVAARRCNTTNIYTPRDNTSQPIRDKSALANYTPADFISSSKNIKSYHEKKRDELFCDRVPPNRYRDARKQVDAFMGVERFALPLRA